MKKFPHIHLDFNVIFDSQLKYLNLAWHINIWEKEPAVYVRLVRKNPNFI